MALTDIIYYLIVAVVSFGIGKYWNYVKPLILKISYDLVPDKKKTTDKTPNTQQTLNSLHDSIKEVQTLPDVQQEKKA